MFVARLAHGGPARPTSRRRRGSRSLAVAVTLVAPIMLVSGSIGTSAAAGQQGGRPAQATGHKPGANRATIAKERKIRRSAAPASTPRATIHLPNSRFDIPPGNAIIPDAAFGNFTPVPMGGTDDGTWPCGPDGVSGPYPCPVDYNGQSLDGPTVFPFGFDINFFGTDYPGAYVNSNGNITFGTWLSTYTPFGLQSTSTIIIAPYFADVDTRVGNTEEIGTGTLDGHKVFVVNWPNVGCFREIDSTQNDFQLILIDRPDLGTGPNGDDFQIEFNYNTMNWDAGQASDGDSNCLNSPDYEAAVVGYSNGTTTPGDSYQLPGSQTSGGLLDTNTTSGLIYNQINSDAFDAVPPEDVPVDGRYIFFVQNGQPLDPSSLTTSLSGGGQSGTDVSVPPDTAVTASAALSGQNSGIASGTVDYSVYSDAQCTNLVEDAGTVDVSNGSVPDSNPITLGTPGTYYWNATYSGDTTNESSTSGCSSLESVVATSTDTSTQVIDNTTGQGVPGTSAVTGDDFYDTATVTPVSSVSSAAVRTGSLHTHGPFTVVGSGSPTGTVTYYFYGSGSDSTCSDGDLAAATSSDTETLDSSGNVPNSIDTGALDAGSYSYLAVYSGDSNYSGSTAPCESFTVGTTDTSTATQVVDASTSSDVPGTSAVTGDSFYDTATVTPVPNTSVGTAGINSARHAAASIAAEGANPPSGTVTYYFYGSGSDSTCSDGNIEAATSSDTETLDSSGNVPNSTETGPLDAGSYSFLAVYSGDGNYNGSTAGCESFTVGKSGTSTSTQVVDFTTGSDVPGSTTATGDDFYDTAAVAAVPRQVSARLRVGESSVGASASPPSGTVIYYFFGSGSDSNCSDGNIQAATSSDSETLDSSGGVPNSTDTGPLDAGSYSYLAVYGGDANYLASTGSCEPFTVTATGSSTATQVVDATTGENVPGSTAVTGDHFYDTATVAAAASQVTGITKAVQIVGFPASQLTVPSGTVTYYFYGGGSDSTCSDGNTGAATSSDTETLDPSGGVPNSADTGSLNAGDYSFLAVYSGDDNYDGSTAGCESFTVAPDSTGTTTGVVDQGGNGVTGDSYYDTATVTPVPDQPPSPQAVQDGGASPPSGTVTYYFFGGGTNSNCSDGNTDAATSSDTETLDNSGNVPNSADVGPLGAGSYSFLAVYSGDGNYSGSTADCEPFTVGADNTSTATITVDERGSGLTGDSYHDTATVTPQTSVRSLPRQAAAATTVAGPGGTLTYTLFSGGCQQGVNRRPARAVIGHPQTVDVTNGVAAASASTGGLAPGTYSYQAVYNGDSNYSASSAACEQFAIKPAPLTIAPSSPLQMTYGGKVPAVTPTYQGFVTGFGPSTVTTPPTCGSTVKSSSAAGVYQTTCAGAVDDAYSIRYRTGQLIVSPAPVTITASSPFMLAGGAVPRVVPLYSGFVNGDSAASLTTAPHCGTTATPNSVAGRYPTTCAGAVDANYSFTYKNGVLTIGENPGYRLEGGDGGLFAFHKSFVGSVPPPSLGLHIFDFVAMATTKTGYWLIEKDGGVFAFGTSRFHGSLPAMGIHVDDIVGVAATPDGGGYWMVSSTGRVYNFGDATDHGDARSLKLDNVVAITSPDAGGYWLLTSAGAVYSFGDAKVLGDCRKASSSCRGVTDVVGMTMRNAGGYWLTTRDGSVFAFGNATLHGSCRSAHSGCGSVHDVVGIASPDPNGYWLAESSGNVLSFGDAKFYGRCGTAGTTCVPLVRPIVAINS